MEEEGERSAGTEHGGENRTPLLLLLLVLLFVFPLLMPLMLRILFGEEKVPFMTSFKSEARPDWVKKT